MRRPLSFGIAMMALVSPRLSSAQNQTAAQAPSIPYVRLAELEIDPLHIAAFNAAIREGIEAAIRLEPDVLTLYAVAEKGKPHMVRVFEVYTSEAAYRTHIDTPHFKKFRAATDAIVKSRKLLDADPILLGAKNRP